MYRNIGRRGDGSDQWQSPSGNLYALEGDHWDITYKNAGGAAPSGGGSGSKTTQKPPTQPSGSTSQSSGAKKPASQHNINGKGDHLVRDYEKLELCRYKDAVGKWTICWGHLMSNPNQYNCLTPTQCEDIYRKDMKRFEDCVKSNVKVPLSSNQYSSLVSFAYNVGCGGFQESLLLKKLNGGDYDAVCPQMQRWVHGDGKVLPGLVRRRGDECKLWKDNQQGPAIGSGSKIPSVSSGSGSKTPSVSSGSGSKTPSVASGSGSTPSGSSGSGSKKPTVSSGSGSQKPSGSSSGSGSKAKGTASKGSGSSGKRTGKGSGSKKKTRPEGSGSKKTSKGSSAGKKKATGSRGSSPKRKSTGSHGTKGTGSKRVLPKKHKHIGSGSSTFKSPKKTSGNAFKTMIAAARVRGKQVMKKYLKTRVVEATKAALQKWGRNVVKKALQKVQNSGVARRFLQGYGFAKKGLLPKRNMRNQLKIPKPTARLSPYHLARNKPVSFRPIQLPFQLQQRQLKRGYKPGYPSYTAKNRPSYPRYPSNGSIRRTSGRVSRSTPRGSRGGVRRRSQRVTQRSSQRHPQRRGRQSSQRMHGRQSHGQRYRSRAPSRTSPHVRRPSQWRHTQRRPSTIKQPRHQHKSPRRSYPKRAHSTRHSASHLHRRSPSYRRGTIARRQPTSQRSPAYRRHAMPRRQPTAQRYPTYRRQAIQRRQPTTQRYPASSRQAMPRRQYTSQRSFPRRINYRRPVYRRTPNRPPTRRPVYRYQSSPRPSYSSYRYTSTLSVPEEREGASINFTGEEKRAITELDSFMEKIQSRFGKDSKQFIRRFAKWVEIRHGTDFAVYIRNLLAGRTEKMPNMGSSETRKLNENLSREFEIPKVDDDIVESILSKINESLENQKLILNTIKKETAEVRENPTPQQNRLHKHLMYKMARQTRHLIRRIQHRGEERRLHDRTINLILHMFKKNE